MLAKRTRYWLYVGEHAPSLNSIWACVRCKCQKLSMLSMKEIDEKLLCDSSECIEARKVEETSKLVHSWHPMSKPIELKTMGKAQEELGECVAVIARCIIQGIEESEPVTGKVNRIWLQEEIADVYANLGLVIDLFELDTTFINERMLAKQQRLREWHSMLEEEK